MDHWATVQLFFSLAQVRCFWRCFCFRSAWSLFSWRCLSVVTLDALTPASVHFLWSSPKCLNRLCLTVFSSLRSSLLLVHISLSNFSFQATLHLICFDTALLEQPPLSVMTLCDLLSLWRVSMIVFWTIAKSAVFPIIVVSKNKRYPEFILYGWSFIETQIKLNILIFEVFYFTCNGSKIYESVTFWSFSPYFEMYLNFSVSTNSR